MDDASQGATDGTAAPDRAVLHAGDACTVVDLTGPDDADLLAAAVADAVTSHPNEVVVDLSGVGRLPDVAPSLRRALRAVSAWPHPPVLVVEPRHRHAAQALERLGAACVDLVPSLPLARVALTARPWAQTRRVRLVAPLVSRAMVLAELDEFLRLQDRGGCRAEAAGVVVDELVSAAIDAEARHLELRLAVDGRRLGVAASWHSDRPMEPDRQLLQAMADGHGVHSEPLATPGWATLAWAGLFLRSQAALGAVPA